MPETTATTKDLRYIQAVQAGLRWTLAERDDTIYFGEDVALPGGPFGSTKGLHKDFGQDRIFDTPISETAMLGMALGAAMTGQRPIIEIMYADFMFVAMDQIVNQIANARYVSEGRWQAPLVVRTQQGYSPGACAQHSQSIESYLVHTPGLRVAVPATADDAYQMIRTAIESEDPTVILEARMLYPTTGPVALDSPVQPIGGARVVRDGADITLISWSTAVSTCLEAAEILAQEGLNAEVVDMRWLNPLDMETVLQSVGRTGRALIVHEANVTGGVGGEIVARISEELFGRLLAPVRRLGAPDVPMPAAPSMQDAVIPDASAVASMARSVCAI